MEVYLRLLYQYYLVLGIQAHRKQVCELVDSKPFVDYGNWLSCPQRNGNDRKR